VVEARPFIKWVGGKRQILHALLAKVPQKISTYFEPFVGGGALFFALSPKLAVLSDQNERLVHAYRGVRDDVEGVIELLSTYPHDRDFFLEMRKRSIDYSPDVDVAAWFIYLNKVGFNGLYRVNAKNVFNVPFGSYDNPMICNADLLRACSKVLCGIDIRHSDFGAVADWAKSGDFVYFDPPYVPLSTTSSFVGYTDKGFGPNDQIRLRDVAFALKERGVNVLLSNSSAGFVRKIYGGRFVCEEVMAARNVSCKAATRKKIAELIIY
jgi:DNA adenine methylase